MKKNHIYGEEELLCKVGLLGDDPDFKKALITASPERKELFMQVNEKKNKTCLGEVLFIILLIVLMVALLR